MGNAAIFKEGNKRMDSLPEEVKHVFEISASSTDQEIEEVMAKCKDVSDIQVVNAATVLNKYNASRVDSHSPG